MPPNERFWSSFDDNDCINYTHTPLLYGFLLFMFIWWKSEVNEALLAPPRRVWDVRESFLASMAFAVSVAAEAWPNRKFHQINDIKSALHFVTTVLSDFYLSTVGFWTRAPDASGSVTCWAVDLALCLGSQGLQPVPSAIDLHTNRVPLPAFATKQRTSSLLSQHSTNVLIDLESLIVT